MTGPVIPENPVPWSQVVGQANTGDILSFAGGSEMDYAIQMVEGQPYTHVGMILNLSGTLYFWDAPGEGQTFFDPVSKNPNQTGARVALLSDILDYYMGVGGETQMWWRQLQPSVNNVQMDALMTFVKLADGTPFPGSELKNLPAPWNLAEGFAASWEFGLKANCTMAGSFFCAQLTAQSYMAMGMLPLSPPANAYDPALFNSTDPKTFQLIGSTLAKPVLIKYP